MCVTAEQWNLPGWRKREGGEKKWIGNAELRGEERYVCSYSREMSLPIEFNKNNREFREEKKKKRKDMYK